MEGVWEEEDDEAELEGLVERKLDFDLPLPLRVSDEPDEEAELLEPDVAEVLD